MLFYICLNRILFIFYYFKLVSSEFWRKWWTCWSFSILCKPWDKIFCVAFQWPIIWLACIFPVHTDKLLWRELYSISCWYPVGLDMILLNWLDCISLSLKETITLQKEDAAEFTCMLSFHLGSVAESRCDFHQKMA